MNTLDPDMVVLGGGVINGGDIVIEKVREVVNSRCLDIIAENCKIEKSNLEHDGADGTARTKTYRLCRG